MNMLKALRMVFSWICLNNRYPVVPILGEMQDPVAGTVVPAFWTLYCGIMQMLGLQCSAAVMEMGVSGSIAISHTNEV